AGRACRPEMEVCNGRDDDCDGEVDEAAAAEMCNGADDDCDGRVDEHATTETCNGADDDCDGSVDEGLECAGTTDGGFVPSDGGIGSGALTAGCGCRVGGNESGAPWLLTLALLALVIARRKVSPSRVC